jgi:hypothetical protein
MGILPHHETTQRLSPERSAAVRDELNSILKSHYFSGSKRCQDFLEFIVQHALDGNFDYLTERFLGAELFGRPINYETGTDSIVRVRANDVRRRLSQYYSASHSRGQVTIDLLSGTYVPEFHWSVPSPPQTTTHDAPAGERSPGAPTPAIAANSGELTPDAQANHRPAWTSAMLIALGLALACFMGWSLKGLTLDQPSSPLKQAPSLAALWSGFLDSGHETDVVLSDASFQLLEDLGKRKFTIDDYLTRRYIAELQSQSGNPDMRFALNLIASKDFGNSSEFRLAERISALDRAGNRIHVYNSRDFSSTLAAQDNVVLIGAGYTNPWQQLFAGRLNFLQSAQTSSRAVINNVPKPGEQATYSPTDAVGYCVVAYLPNLDRNTSALLIEGSSSEATEAGGDFLLSDDKLASFEKRLNVNKLPYFEVLLKTSEVRGTPITATVETYRVYSGQH